MEYLFAHMNIQRVHYKCIISNQMPEEYKEKQSNQGPTDHYQGNSMIKRTSKKNLGLKMIPSNCLNL